MAIIFLIFTRIQLFGGFFKYFIKTPFSKFNFTLFPSPHQTILNSTIPTNASFPRKGFPLTQPLSYLLERFYNIGFNLTIILPVRQSFQNHKNKNKKKIRLKSSSLKYYLSSKTWLNLFSIQY